MNNKQLTALLKLGQNKMVSLGDGLYFRVARGTASWVVKYTIGGQRAQIALPNRFPTMSITQAKQEALRIRENVKLGIDPKSERQKETFAEIRTVNQLFEDWYQNDLTRNLKHPHIPKRYYTKEMKKHIGVMTIGDVTPQHIRHIIDDIMASGRPSIANKVLQSAKQLFNHAIKLNLIAWNPALPFTPKDAGGSDKSRERALTKEEIAEAFSILRQHEAICTRPNYLALCLLLSLGCRKGELISARWEQFDFEKRIWHCIPNKKRRQDDVKPISIPLTSIVICWLRELQRLAAGSQYVFPNRKKTKSSSHISNDTLNHALAKMFGKKVDSNKKPYPNYLSTMEHFTIHDLRRTCRTLLAELGVDEKVAELCLNHKVKGVVGIYDRYRYFDERKEALERLSALLTPLLSPEHPKGNVVRLAS
ncbi:tyrosine-type recombinase/integrase [Vibrio parahaemolyticus]